MKKIKSSRADRILLNGFCHKYSTEAQGLSIIISTSDAENAIIVAEEDAEIRCKQVFCQVIHEMVRGKLNGVNAVDRYDELLKQKCDE